MKAHRRRLVRDAQRREVVREAAKCAPRADALQEVEAEAALTRVGRRDERGVVRVAAELAARAAALREVEADLRAGRWWW
jgi:hypothetical protein